MKRFLFIISLIGIATVIIISSYFIFFRNDNYCKQFSGSAGYFEGETLAKECENAGCKVINKTEFSSMSEVKTCDKNTGECSKINIPLPDSGGYSFDCVPVKSVDKFYQFSQF